MFRSSHRLQSSSFLGLPCDRILNMNHKKKLQWSLWVVIRYHSGGRGRGAAGLYFFEQALLDPQQVLVRGIKERLLGGSWVVISRVTSPLIWIVTTVTLLVTPLITTHEPPSTPLSPTGAHQLAFFGVCLTVSVAHGSAPLIGLWKFMTPKPPQIYSGGFISAGNPEPPTPKPKP